MIGGVTFEHIMAETCCCAHLLPFKVKQVHPALMPDM